MTPPSPVATPAPRQARSARSLGRILDAAAALLEERPFDAVSVAQIAARARTSVGNVYARFADKQAILDELHRRHEAERAGALAARLERAGREATDLRARVTAIVEIFVDYYAARPGVIRSFVLRYRNRPDDVTPAMRARLDGLYGQAERLLLERRFEIGHPRPAIAVRAGVFFVAAACRDRFLFAGDPHASHLALATAAVSRELVVALLSYLSAPEVADADRAPVPRRVRPARGL